MCLCSCMHQSLKSEDVCPGDVDFKAVSEAAFFVTTSHIPNELDLAHSICCPATSNDFSSFFIFFFTLCWQHQLVFWLCCSCPVSPPVFFFINQKNRSKGRSITRCSLLCQVDFKQVQLPERWGLTPTQPCYCLWFCVFVVFLCVYVKERGVSSVNSECPWCLEVLHWSSAMHRGLGGPFWITGQDRGDLFSTH